MTRILALYLPDWPVQWIRRQLAQQRGESSGPTPRPPEPLLRVEQRGGAQFVAACSPEARARGVRTGVSLTHARSLTPEAIVTAADPAGDRAALERLARWATRFSPAVAADPPDGLLLDVTGCERLFRGDANLLNQVCTALRGLGLTAAGAIADTAGAAWAVAHAGGEPQSIVPPGQQYAAIAHLPPWALRISPETVSRLATLGIERIEALLMLPRSTLPSRFGEELLLRIDQALGRASENITPVAAPAEPSVCMDFEDPLRDPAALAMALRQLVEQIVLQLAAQGCGARRIELLLLRTRRIAARQSVTLCAPNRSPRHLGALLQTQLERIDPREGFDALRLVAAETGPIAPRQGELFEAQSPAATEQAAELFDRLSARLGEQQVVRPVLAESHMPEKAWKAVATSTPLSLRPFVPSSLPHCFRPLRLLPHPRPIQALAVVPDQPPSWIRCDGVEHRIRTGVGPERLCGEWWQDDGEARDYFRIETEAGRRYWVFRETPSQRWFLHGMFE